VHVVHVWSASTLARGKHVSSATPVDRGRRTTCDDNLLYGRRRDVEDTDDPSLELPLPATESSRPRRAKSMAEASL
jgi:hypothetical protein